MVVLVNHRGQRGFPCFHFYNFPHFLLQSESVDKWFYYWGKKQNAKKKRIKRKFFEENGGENLLTPDDFNPFKKVLKALFFPYFFHIIVGSPHPRFVITFYENTVDERASNRTFRASHQKCYVTFFEVQGIPRQTELHTIPLNSYLAGS